MDSPTSGITANSTDLDQHHLSSLKLSARECLSSDWTDEKHSMYLKSMEASFVDQLYTSMNSTARLTLHKPHPQPRLKSTKRSQLCPPTQSKVHQTGSSCDSSTFNKGEPSPQQTQQECTQHCGVGMTNHRLAWGNSAEGGPVLNSGARMLYSSVGQEFSDQNFDEEDDEEAGGVMFSSKRPKIIAKSSSSKYQVKVQKL